MSYGASPLTEVKMGARGPFDELASRPWEVRGSNDTPIGFTLLKPRKASEDGLARKLLILQVTVD